MPQYAIIATTSPKDGITRVKFDDDFSDEAAHHRHVMIGHLTQEGHVLEHVPRCPEHGNHLIVHSGPLKR